MTSQRNPDGAPAPVPEPPWLTWSRELQAMAQTGLTFSKDPYDLERYRRLRTLALQMMALGAGTALEPLEALFAQDMGYPTPKVDVRGAVIRDDQILMVRETSDGRWTLPGGWADVNQSAGACVEREIREESGYQARAIKLAAVWDSQRQGYECPHPYTIYKMFFICELIGGSAQPSLETSEVAFFCADALPDLSLGRVNATQIARMFVHSREPLLPADFD
ncbi:MAG TPA: NUDIX hydrolase [Steroidobacteraceae bacterium]|nr:NUDIX hydrolase [Steroidobacteraceae bacterium]